MKMYFSNKEVKVMESMLNEVGVEFSILESLTDGGCKRYYAEDLNLKMFDKPTMANINKQYGHVIKISGSEALGGYWVDFNDDFFVDSMNIYRTTVVQVVRGIVDLIAKVSFFVKPMIDNFIKKWKKPEVEEEVTWAKPTPAKTPVVDEEVENILNETLDELNDDVYSAPKDEVSDVLRKFDPFANFKLEDEEF